jgi:hypothetical protein
LKASTVLIIIGVILLLIAGFGWLSIGVLVVAVIVWLGIILIVIGVGFKIFKALVKEF